MRKTPITRRTPLTRSPLKRAKPKYPTARQLAERREWGAFFDCCWVCGSTENLETHEIASRAQAPLRWCDVRNLFRGCHYCNGDFLNWAPEAVQLALKAIHDPFNYDREFVNQLRHRATEAIGQSVIDWWVRLLRR